MLFFIQTVPSVPVPPLDEASSSSDATDCGDTEPPSNRSTLKREQTCPYECESATDEEEGSAESGRSTLTRGAAQSTLGLMASERVMRELEEAWRRDDASPAVVNGANASAKGAMATVNSATPVVAPSASVRVPKRVPPVAPCEASPAGVEQKRFTYVVDREFGVEV